MSLYMSPVNGEPQSSTADGHLLRTDLVLLPSNGTHVLVVAS